MQPGAGLAFALHVLLSRLMGVEHYGVYVCVLSWLTILAMMGKMGLDSTLLRYVAAYVARREWGALGDVCDSDPACAADFARRFEIPVRASDEALASPEIGGLGIATSAPDWNLLAAGGDGRQLSGVGGAAVCRIMGPVMPC